VTLPGVIADSAYGLWSLLMWVVHEPESWPQRQRSEPASEADADAEEHW